MLCSPGKAGFTLSKMGGHGGSGSWVSGVTERMRVVYYSNVRLRRDCDGARAGESHGSELRKPQ